MQTSNSEAQKKGKAQAEVTPAGEFFDWCECIIGAIIALVVIFVFIVRVTVVDGPSMNPTLTDGDRLLMSDLFYTPAHNDIVILQANGLVNDRGEYGKPIVKRVIGIAGDKIRVDFDNGIVYRNGEALSLEEVGGVIYEDGHMINDYTTRQLDMTGEVTVPEGYVFVMGDNRNRSTDSRSNLVGMVETEYIVGHAFFRITPVSSIGFIN